MQTAVKGALETAVCIQTAYGVEGLGVGWKAGPAPGLYRSPISLVPGTLARSSIPRHPVGKHALGKRKRSRQARLQ